MAPSAEEDWSDSDEEVGSEVETSVLLGVPDGPITSVNELADAAVSRIGGHPAFLLANDPPISSCQCKICSLPMELLVQMWCPFENSPMDRALYVWGCANPGCQRKDGSVRAWRGLRYNEKYAAKLEAKLARKSAQEEAKRQVEQAKQASKANPFSLKVSSNTKNPFGLGAQIFGDTSSGANDMKNDQLSEDEESEAESSTSEQSLLTAMTNTTLSESPWTAAPAYLPPLYLSTASEYLPPQPKTKISSSVEVSEPSVEGGRDISWAFEPYENSLEVDQVFERFTKRVGYEGEQCIRYDLNGTPLPFSSDKIFESLFPTPVSDSLPVTEPDFKIVLPQKRIYTSSDGVLSPCKICKGKRIFECQLMPNLINILRNIESRPSKTLSDEDRRTAVQQTLKGGSEKGMEWGTCMIFSCKNDCRVDEEGKEENDVWREELVLVQWDV
ncbi:programmed cell death protein 2 [Lentinula aciculospora]|uniref:Programmed cell death protein 2 n=1 Tax=Lentinula aciculospora TaxID=153920 RepID=A0A9W9A4D4_9AGAR|nr:programmed cell death protein 2 [Lentinula aciculospora]